MKRRIDKRLILIPVAVAATALGGLLINMNMTDAATATVDATSDHTMLGDEQARRAHQSFQQAVAMLQAEEFDYAVTALHDVLSIYPALPEAHLNMGYAFLGLGDAQAAADFFNSASDLRPTLHSAYYGLALAARENGNDKAALAAMQAFAHLAAENDRHLPRAQAFIWELQAATREASR